MEKQQSGLKVKTMCICNNLTHHKYIVENCSQIKSCLITFAGIGLENTKPRAEFIRSAREAGYSSIHAITDQSKSWYTQGNLREVIYSIWLEEKDQVERYILTGNSMGGSGALYASMIMNTIPEYSSKKIITLNFSGQYPLSQAIKQRDPRVSGHRKKIKTCNEYKIVENGSNSLIFSFYDSLDTYDKNYCSYFANLDPSFVRTYQLTGFGHNTAQTLVRRNKLVQILAEARSFKWEDLKKNGFSCIG